MGVHNDKAVGRLLREIERIGFRIVMTKKGVYKMTPPSHIQGPVYVTHGTSKAFHPIRRDFRKFYGIELGE
jgi:hypothetical protein